MRHFQLQRLTVIKAKVLFRSFYKEKNGLFSADCARQVCWQWCKRSRKELFTVWWAKQQKTTRKSRYKCAVLRLKIALMRSKAGHKHTAGTTVTQNAQVCCGSVKARKVNENIKKRKHTHTHACSLHYLRFTYLLTFYLLFVLNEILISTPHLLGVVYANIF